MELTREYEPTYPLPYPLDQFQNLIDHKQPIGGACGAADCEPAECCDKCVQHMDQQGRAESFLVNTLAEPQLCLTSQETDPAMTWQLILAVQESDATALIHPAAEGRPPCPASVHE